MKEEIILEQIKGLKVKPVVRSFTLGVFPKDLHKFLEDDEVIMGMRTACKKGITHFIKGGKYIRSYLVSTDRKIIYIERGNKILSLLKILSKTYCIPKNEILKVEIEDVAVPLKLFYSKLMTLETSKKKYSFYMVEETDQNFVDDRRQIL